MPITTLANNTKISSRERIARMSQKYQRDKTAMEIADIIRRRTRMGKSTSLTFLEKIFTAEELDECLDVAIDAALFSRFRSK